MQVCYFKTRSFKREVKAGGGREINVWKRQHFCFAKTALQKLR